MPVFRRQNPEFGPEFRNGNGNQGDYRTNQGDGVFVIHKPSGRADDGFNMLTGQDNFFQPPALDNIFLV